MITLSRRKLLGGLGLLIAAPAIVKASSLMPVKAYAADVMPELFMARPGTLYIGDIVTLERSTDGFQWVKVSGEWGIGSTPEAPVGVVLEAGNQDSLHVVEWSGFIHAAGQPVVLR